ncbi:acyltransferase family protein [Herbaspirillum sp. alder98]|uniref:acyltransferase family protein n=1 Tax=Herbaspirillum sp. alder98 TaxID=2913096 RepID=UPI001CD822D6|nr:acyltransferase [Herbaspirillum sp. alder98]MCA1322891.1 acyltransferase [Herbaspirillum sp. alder98]
MSLQKRVNELDLLRFLAAVAVMFFHFAFRGHAADGYTQMDYLALKPVAKYGYLGVYFFFMISGFVIFMTASNNSVRGFFISRFTRLYPAFWICCSVTFLTSLVIGGARFPVSLWQYIVNMITLGSSSSVPQIDGVYWSLWIEIRFYFLVLLFMALRLIRYEQTFLWVWAVGTWILEHHPIRALNDLFVVEYAWYFIAGAAMYQLWSKGPAWHRFALILLSFVLSTLKAMEFVQSMASYYKTDFSSISVAICMAVFFLIMLLISLRKTMNLGRQHWATLGAISYPLYLIHQYFGYMIANRFLLYWDSVTVFWLTVGISLLLAWQIHVWLEKPLSRALKALLEFFPKSRRIKSEMSS